MPAGTGNKSSSLLFYLLKGRYVKFFILQSDNKFLL